MTMKKTTSKIICAALAFLMLTSSCLPFINAFAKSDTFILSDEKDFINLAKKCKTDTWSQGKIILLTNNIDLSKSKFSPIPTFGGTFDGNGYTISGVNINKKSSHTGLMRYIQESGTVKNLNVSGNVAPDGTKKYVGGIAGENSGSVINCSFSGKVEGDANVGGICGYITESGTVTDCTFIGSVTGKSYTGGICGQNYGLINNSTNKGNINTTDTETAKSIQDLNIDTQKLGTTESIDTSTDTGGICGFSKGKIIGCTNRGNVGYKSVGYNTGGICGRHSGTISDCKNYGTINGRKDIGGIAGQAEPYILLEYTEDALEQIDDILERVQNIIDNSTLLTDNSLSDTLDKIDGKMGDLTDTAEIVSNDAKKYADGVSDAVNDFSGRLHNALDSSSKVTDNISKSTDKFSEGMSYLKNSGDYLKSIVESIESASEEAKDSYDYFENSAKALKRAMRFISDACDIIEESAEDLDSGSRKLQASLKALSDLLGKNKNPETGFKEIWSNLGEISDSMSNTETSLSDAAKALKTLKDEGYIKSDINDIVQKLQSLAQSYNDIVNAISRIRDACLILAENFDIYSIASAIRLLYKGFDYLIVAINSACLACDNLSGALDKLDGVSDKAVNAVSELQKATDFIGEGMDYLSISVNELSKIIDKATAGGSVKMPSASDIFGDDFDNLFDNLKSMQSEFSELNDILKSKKNKLSDETDRLNNELSAFTDVLSDTYDEHMDSDKDSFTEDVSDKDGLKNAGGRTEGSYNFGAVYADINGAGIVGSMAIEYDFDPEDDIKNSGKKSLNFTYKTKCVLRRCKNEGKVTVKKNYGGGIVGRMDLGSIMSCENYGNILNTDGDYTGGIAGISDMVIRNCVSKCDLSGNNYVGGIAGQGKTISNCYALVNVKDYGEFAGSIAGSADKEDLYGNRFVSEVLGAVDDINYTSIASETDIKTFADFVKAEFGTNVTFTLKFVANGKEIKSIDFEYKSAIPQSEIPKVPEKKGYYGKWSSYNYDEALYDAVIKAKYYRDIKIIESDLKRDKGKSVVLVCGAFNDSADVRAKKNENYSDNINKRKILDSYSVNINGVYTEKYIVRYLPSGKKNNVNLVAEANGKIKKLKSKKFGSYIEFEVPNSSFNIYEVKKDYTIIIAISVLMLIALTSAIILRKRIKNRIIKK